MPKETELLVVQRRSDRFKPYVEGLLDLASAKSDEKTEDALHAALQWALIGYSTELGSEQRPRPPVRLLGKLEKSIKKTRELLRDIRKYGGGWEDTGFVVQPVGRGIVDVVTIKEMILHGRCPSLPREPSISERELYFPTCDRNEMIAIINVEPLLRAVVRPARKRGVGGQTQLGKRSVIAYAINFFRKHSPETLKSAPEKRNEFVERFYEAVTEKHCEPGNLDYLIGVVLRNECAEGARDSKEHPADAPPKQVSDAVSKKVVRLRKMNRQKKAI